MVDPGLYVCRVSTTCIDSPAFLGLHLSGDKAYNHRLYASGPNSTLPNAVPRQVPVRDASVNTIVKEGTRPSSVPFPGNPSNVDHSLPSAICASWHRSRSCQTIYAGATCVAAQQHKQASAMNPTPTHPHHAAVFQLPAARAVRPCSELVVHSLLAASITPTYSTCWCGRGLLSLQLMANSIGVC